MVNVYDWNRKTPPEKPTIEDLRFGIGYMNDNLMQMTHKMSELIRTIGALEKNDVSETIRMFDKSTLGRQIRILDENYSGIEIIKEKLETIVEKRNHFIHEFDSNRNKDLVGEAKNLSDLINLIRKMQGSLNNATQKTSRATVKKANECRHDLRNKIISMISSCEQYDPNRVNLVVLAPIIRSGGIKYIGKFYRFLESNGIKTHIDSKNKTTRYVETKSCKVNTNNSKP